MRRCVIITAYIKKPIREIIHLREDDWIVCADGGYEAAAKEGITPDVIIGDFDSGKRPQGDLEKVIQVPVEKDDTDTLLCLKYGMKKGYFHFIIIGGMGGRVDHTLANIQSLVYALDNGRSAVMTDGDNILSILKPGSYSLKRREGYKLSLLSHSDLCTGITITGVHYPLFEASISNSNCVGISNEIETEEARLSFRTGLLMTIYSRDARSADLNSSTGKEANPWDMNRR